MASDPPAGMGGFFPGMFGDLLKLLRTDAPFPIELTQQLAESVAGEGEPRPVDPLDRIRLEGLVRIAELQVADVSGMTTAGQPITIDPLGRVEWVRANLANWRPALEQLALELRPDPNQPPVVAPADDEEDSELGDFGALIQQWSGAIAPSLIAMQFGSLIGHLARRTLGQYELVLPRSDNRSITVVPENVAEFADDWSLAKDDVAFYLTVRDVALHAVVTRPHVRDRLLELIVRHARGFRPDPGAMQAALGGVSLGDSPGIDEIGNLLGSPSALGSMADTPEQRRVHDELSSLAAAIGGYAEWVTREVTDRSIGSSGPIAEALRRRRVERGEDERAADALFGLSLDQPTLDRGEDFVRGVIARGAERELASLFVVTSNLPTPAEIGAPGLWIERINLPADPEAGASD